MSKAIELILGVVLSFVWGRVEKWIKKEIRYQQNKRVLIEEVKDVAKQAAEENAEIAIDRESIDDSLVRLERIVVKRRDDSNQRGVNPSHAGREGGSSTSDS